MDGKYILVLKVTDNNKSMWVAGQHPPQKVMRDA
jgi:hypothetical protein